LRCRGEAALLRSLGEAECLSRGQGMPCPYTIDACGTGGCACIRRGGPTSGRMRLCGTGGSATSGRMRRGTACRAPETWTVLADCPLFSGIPEFPLNATADTVYIARMSTDITGHPFSPRELGHASVVSRYSDRSYPGGLYFAAVCEVLGQRGPAESRG